jgi:hypothetical protein
LASINHPPAQTPFGQRLESKHSTLEAEIHAELKMPAPDTDKIQELKKKKLQLRERICRSG